MLFELFVSLRNSKVFGNYVMIHIAPRINVGWLPTVAGSSVSHVLI